MTLWHTVTLGGNMARRETPGERALRDQITETKIELRYARMANDTDYVRELSNHIRYLERELRDAAGA